MFPNRFSPWFVLVLALLLGASACDCGDDDDDDDDNDQADDDADDDTADDDTTDDDVVTYDYFEDFEAYPVGAPPGGGWDSSSLLYGATALVESLDKAAAGHVLELSDPTPAGNGSVIAPIPANLLQNAFRLDWDWRWVSGEGLHLGLFTADELYPMTGGGGLNGGNLEALSRVGDSGSWVICLYHVAYGDWHKLTALVDVAAGTYSVLIDGEETNCTDLSLMAPEATIEDVRLVMYNDGFGILQTDNLGLAPLE